MPARPSFRLRGCGPHAVVGLPQAPDSRTEPARRGRIVPFRFRRKHNNGRVHTVAHNQQLLKSKLFWVGILYFAQGFPFGVFYDVFPVHFRQLGVDLREIGFLSLLGLAWTVKFLWAPAVDHYRHHRRWMLAVDLGMGAAAVFWRCSPVSARRCGSRSRCSPCCRRPTTSPSTVTPSSCSQERARAGQRHPHRLRPRRYPRGRRDPDPERLPHMARSLPSRP